MVNSVLVQRCKIGMVVGLGKFDLQQGDHEGRCFKRARPWNPEWEILNSKRRGKTMLAFPSFLINRSVVIKRLF